MQIVEVMRNEQEKWSWLLQRLVEMTSAGSVLLFVTRKANSEEVATSLRTEGYSGLVTHNVHSHTHTHSHGLHIQLMLSY